MKRLIMPVTVILVLLALIILNQFFMYKITASVTDNLQMADAAAVSGDTAACAAYIEKAITAYSKYEWYLHVITGHTALNQLEQHLRVLQTYAQWDNVQQIQIECKKAELILNEIYDTDSFSLENIF